MDAGSRRSSASGLAWAARVRASLTATRTAPVATSRRTIVPRRRPSAARLSRLAAASSDRRTPGPPAGRFAVPMAGSHWGDVVSRGWNTPSAVRNPRTSPPRSWTTRVARWSWKDRTRWTRRPRSQAANVSACAAARARAASRSPISRAAAASYRTAAGSAGRAAAARRRAPAKSPRRSAVSITSRSGHSAASAWERWASAPDGPRAARIDRPVRARAPQWRDSAHGKSRAEASSQRPAPMASRAWARSAAARASRRRKRLAAPAATGRSQAPARSRPARTRRTGRGSGEGIRPV